MNVQPIQAIEEVNMFKEDGNVIHFSAPKGKRQPNRATTERVED
jgi:nascent polypeptide-associated complex subunit beta